MSDKYKQLLSLLIPYSFLVAAAWHLPYWSTFDINPFEYMGINDIVMSFIYPFVFSILLYAATGPLAYSLGYFIGMQRHERRLQKKVEQNKEVEVQETEQKTSNKIILSDRLFQIIAIGSIGCMLVWTLIYAETDKKWMIVPFEIEMIVTLCLFVEDFDKYFKLDGRGKAIVLISTGLLAVAILKSKIKAFDVRESKCYEYTLAPDITNERLKVLGKLGDYMMLTTLDNKTKYIVSLGSKDAFQIQSFDSYKK